ncbi:MAG: PAS domain S-box protein [Desulfobulbaceae bacterium]|nr:PAS domain S-box protein [Desulfobulbaceae bacterium]
MQIEKLSIKTATVAIFTMIALVAVVLSLLAGTYFKKAAMEAQISSLSRVIEVASQQMLKKISQHNFELGMKLGHNKQLISILKDRENESSDRLITLLDDPFINGFSGFSDINLVNLRLYSLDFEFIAACKAGIIGLNNHLPKHLAAQVIQKKKRARLRAVDSLWLSENGPLFSTLVPVGGLNAVGYLEVVADPVFNLADIGNITKTPVDIISLNRAQKISQQQSQIREYHLPVAYILKTSDGIPAFEIIGYEDVTLLSKAMEETQLITTGGFLLLTLCTLLFALWLFNRFLFQPLNQVVKGMREIASGRLNFSVKKTGLHEFVTFADSFELMSNQVKIRTNELERLLDLDISAILCFKHDGEAIYFNKAATELLGYPCSEIDDLHLNDLFSDEVVSLIKDTENPGGQLEDHIVHTRLESIRKDGCVCQCEAIISPMDVKSRLGYTIVLTPVVEQDPELNDYVVNSIEKNELRMLAVENSVNSILEIAKNNPGLLAEFGGAEGQNFIAPMADDEKSAVRAFAVSVMNAALACWEHDIGGNKIELAEQSGVWPVYLDKSTPTTRTLDKYLHIDSCPQNPRSQRVIDTAEFVLKHLKTQRTEHRSKLEKLLETFRISKKGA